MTALRSMAEPNKGKLRGPAARAPFDAISGRTIAPEGVTFREDQVGGIPGCWCEPAEAVPAAAILHLHGGWFNWGSSAAYRHLVGHIARSARAVALCRTTASRRSTHFRLQLKMPKPVSVVSLSAAFAESR